MKRSFQLTQAALTVLAASALVAQQANAQSGNVSTGSALEPSVINASPQPTYAQSYTQGGQQPGQLAKFEKSKSSIRQFTMSDLGVSNNRYNVEFKEEKPNEALKEMASQTAKKYGAEILWGQKSIQLRNGWVIGVSAPPPPPMHQPGRKDDVPSSHIDMLPRPELHPRIGVTHRHEYQ